MDTSNSIDIVDLSPPLNEVPLPAVTIKITRPKRKRKQADAEHKEGLPTVASQIKKRAKKTSSKGNASKSVETSTNSDNICQVCCENLGGNTHQHIKCPRCPYKACKSCHQRFLLNSIGTPHCMNCRNRWTYKDLLVLFKASFVNKTFRKQRGQYLLDRSKSHLPLAMPYADAEKSLSKLDEELKPLLKEYANLKRSVRMGLDAPNREELYRRYIELGNILTVKRAERYHLNNQSYNNRNRRRRGQDTYAVYEEPCPMDNCRGFIEKGSHKCGICKTFVCRKCTKPLGKLNCAATTSITSFMPSVQSKKELDELDEMLEEIEKFEKKNSVKVTTEDDNEDLDMDVDVDEDEKKENKNTNHLSPPNAVPSSSSNLVPSSSSSSSDETKTGHIPSDDINDDDEKILAATNLSEEEKKELRKLKKTHKCKQEDVDSILVQIANLEFLELQDATLCGVPNVVQDLIGELD